MSGGTTTGYAYDNDGNLTTDGPATNAYNAQDQLTSATTSAGTTNYSYTLNGELASATPPGGPAANDTWDAYGDVASAGTVSYGYDALGRLTTRAAGSGSATSLSYLGTSDTLASDGTSDYSYTPSGAVTGAQQSGGTAYTTMTDQHGDVIGAFSPTASTTSLAGSSSYSPYGTETNANDAENLGYQGDYTDPTTGLVYMNARWYNPATGTFTSSDTLGGTPVPSTVDGNPYAYAGGNPLTNTDLSGQGCLGGLGWLCSAAQTAVHDYVSAAQTVFHFEESAYVNVGTCLLFGCATSLGDDDCPSYGCGYEGGSPAPMWSPAPPPYPSPSPSEQQPPGCDWNCMARTVIGVGVAVGIGTIAGVCADQPELCVPVSPPPPPPPPQDCYTDGECKIPNAPSNVAKKPLETDPNPAPKDPHVTIDEKTPTTTPKTPKGLEPSDDTQPPAGSGGPGGGPPVDTPPTPEPPDPATGNTAGGPSDTPATTPETPTTPDTTSTGDNSGSSGNGNSGEDGHEQAQPKRIPRFVTGSHGVTIDTAAINPLAGTYNCVACVVAQDATLGGSPAAALDTEFAMTTEEMEDYFESYFHEVSGPEEISNILTDLGSGARGIVYGEYLDSEGEYAGSHVWNAVNDNGNIRFPDGQSGREAEWEGYSDFFFMLTEGE